MSSQFQPPLMPGFGSNVGALAGGTYAPTRNPFFSIGNQFLPRNLHDVIRWVRFITVQSPVTTEVIRKLSTYPITSFTLDAKDPAVKAKYDEIIKTFKLKQTLHDVGFQYHTIGNVFMSIYFPINRSYRCPNCRALHGATQNPKFVFKNYTMTGNCPACGTSVIFETVDTKSKNIKDMNLIVWDPLNISVNHNPITGKSQYFYKIPNEIRKKVLAGDRLTVDTIPAEMIAAVKDNKDFEFESDHIFHLRNVDMGMSVNGISVPPLVSHFNLVFYQATLRRANESIATDFMAPMRVIFPQPQTANSDPVVAVSMRNFVSKMEEAMVKHKQDNNHVLIAPVPVGYQAISGEGKALLVNAEIAQAEESLLLSLGVSRELLSGTTNWTSSTVGLRMLKNTLDSYVGQIEDLLDWITAKVSSYLTIPNVKMRMTPFQLTDDDALKNVIVALTQTGNVSMTTVYESLGRSYEDELDRMAEDAKRKARHQVRTKFEIEQSEYLEGLEINKTTEKDDSYMETLAQCQAMAEQLINADDTSVRTVLNELQVTDYAKFLLVSKLLVKAREDQLVSASTQAELQASQNPEAPGSPGKSGKQPKDANSVPGSKPESAEASGEDLPVEEQPHQGSAQFG